MATDENALQAGLEEAAREEVISEESSTTESAEAAPEESGEDKAKPKKGAQDRIRELVTARKTLESKLEELEQASKKKDGELGELIKLIQARESDTRTIQAIKDLHASDPGWREAIERLDKKLKGEEIELEAQTEKTEAKTDDYSKVKDLLKQTSKLENSQQELRDQMILDKVDRVVDRYFENLPDEYNKDDRRVLQKMLADYIDWDGISDNPDALTQKVAAGIQSAIDFYGAPRGAAPSAKADQPAAKTEQPDPKARLESLMKKDYGKSKLVETNGQKRFEPIVSEDQWVKELGEALRLSRQTPQGG